MLFRHVKKGRKIKSLENVGKDLIVSSIHFAYKKTCSLYNQPHLT